MRFNTPLRYPGGKGKLSPYVIKLLTMNGLKDIHYAEPYAGGAGLAINLLLSGNAKHIYLNDLNKCVYSFWYSVLNHHEELCKLISSANVDMNTWFQQKNIVENHEEADVVKLGFATFFLNRTNRSGILKGGVIGGKEQKGLWKIDARFNKENLIERIKNIARHKENIHIFNLDAIEFIDNICKPLPENTLIYLDPPYFVKGKGLYENHYKYDDHVRIANKVINELTLPWIVSYDNVREITDMYDKTRKICYGINYSVQDRYLGSEVMFFSKKIKPPKLTK